MIILLEKTTLIKSKKEEEEVIPILSHTSRKHYTWYIFWTTSVKWNFTKFLVDKHGTPIKRYGPSTQPLRITKDIEKLLLLQDM